MTIIGGGDGRLARFDQLDIGRRPAEAGHPLDELPATLFGSRREPDLLQGADLRDGFELVAGDAPGSDDGDSPAVLSREMPGRETRSAPVRRSRQVRALHHRRRTARLSIEQGNEGRHSGNGLFLVLIEIGDDLDPVPPARLEKGRVEDCDSGRRLGDGEAPQALDRTVLGQNPEGFGLHVNRLGHAEKRAHVPARSGFEAPCISSGPPGGYSTGHCVLFK